MDMRLAIVEDDPLLLSNLKLLLGGEPGMTIVGAFSTAEEALAKIEKSPPEVMLVDLGLPGMPGTQLIREAKARIPDVEIMAYTVFENRENVFSALKSGASGYILKGCTPKELIESLFILERGGAPMSPKIARAVIQEFQSEATQEQYLLTNREKEILKNLENGLAYKEIAALLGISPHTVHTHIKKIYEKLHVKSRQEAFLKARKKGII